jgi:hypothetical protein
MSTAIADPSSTVAAHAPVDLAKTLYGTPSVPSPVTQEETPTSTPNPETGTAPPAQGNEPSAGEVKPDPQKEAEAERVKAAEKAKADAGHAKAALKLGREVQELKSRMSQVIEENRVLQARLDGTYEEPQQPTPEQIAERAKFEGREIASRELANQKYGAEHVEERIYAEQSEYKGLIAQEPWYHVRVANSPQPTLEAWTVLEEHAFKAQYGNDPTQWTVKIIAEARPAIEAEITKKLHVTPTGQPAPSVTQARGDGGPTARTKSLAELLYDAPART